MLRKELMLLPTRALSMVILPAIVGLSGTVERAENPERIVDGV